MIFQKFNLKSVFYLLLISNFIAIYSSQPAKEKTGMLNFKINKPVNDSKPTPRSDKDTVTANPTSPQPSNTEEIAAAEAKKIAQAQAITDYLKSREEFEIIDPSSAPAQQVLEEKAVPQAAEVDALGMIYPFAGLPEQNKEILSAQGMFESLAAYLDRIIVAGEFKAAHAKDKKQYSKVGEDSGTVLTTIVTNLGALLERQKTEKEQIYKTHRKDLTAIVCQLLRLVKANNQPYSQGSINQQRIETALKGLEAAQKLIEHAHNPVVEECDKIERVINNLRIETLKLHPTASSQPQIPTRRQIMIQEPSKN